MVVNTLLEMKISFIVILSLTRDLGVNLAGVEIILNMREKMNQMQSEFERFFEYLQAHADEFAPAINQFPDSEALIPISRLSIFQVRRTHNKAE